MPRKTSLLALRINKLHMNISTLESQSVRWTFFITATVKAQSFSVSPGLPEFKWETGLGKAGGRASESGTYLWPSSWAMVKAKLRPLSSASTHFLLALHTPPK